MGVKEHLDPLRRGYRPVNHAPACSPEGAVDPGVVGGVAGIADITLREIPGQLHGAAAVLVGKRLEVVVNGVNQVLCFVIVIGVVIDGEAGASHFLGDFLAFHVTCAFHGVNHEDTAIAVYVS